jgi:hypothetical protein
MWVDIIGIYKIYIYIHMIPYNMIFIDMWVDVKMWYNRHVYRSISWFDQE